MSSPLYYATVVDKKGTTVKVELAIVHPDVSDFGTDRLFAWKLLHERVSPPDDGSDVELASRYVKDVKLSPVKNATVDKTKADFFTVKRKGKKNPSVIYTIDLTDSSLLADVAKGDSDEVYDYVEPGKGKALTAPGTAPKKQATTAVAGATFADFRNAAIALIGKHSFWAEHVLEKGTFQRWARNASDDEVAGWIAILGADFRAPAAAAIAIDRTDAASAKRFLKIAETAHKPKDEYNNRHGLPALIPAWWKLGKAKEAEAGLKKLLAEQKKDEVEPSRAAHILFGIYARGGQWAKATAVVKDCLDQDYDTDCLVPGLVAAFVAGQTNLFDAMMAKWTELEPSSPHEELSMELLRIFLEEGKPERYLELLLAWPKVISDFSPAFYAYQQVEVKDRKLAVALGTKLLAADHLHSNLHQQVLAVFRRHAPAKADAWIEKNKAKLREESWIGMFVAAGHDVRKKVAKLDSRRLGDVVDFAIDPVSVLAALERSLDSSGRDLDTNALVHLVDLGHRARVEKVLEAKLAQIGKLATKDRDLACRYLAATAVTLDRPDIGFAAIKLPGPKLREYTAGSMVQAAVAHGDYTTALAALQFVPDDDSNGRASSAVHALVHGENAFVSGPRAIPLRAISDTYARGLIAANDRAGIDTILAIAARDQLSDDVRVEIDAFLEGRVFSPRV